MGLGAELSITFRRLSAKGSFDEKKLFEKLIESFHNLGARYPNHFVVKIHGPVSFVEFISNEHYIDSIIPGSVVMKELGDLRFIAVSPSTNEARICFMQNKVKHVRYLYSSFPRAFKADLLQLELLKTRPRFTRGGTAYDILTNAECPSIASYGVFFKRLTGYDMSYFSAHLLDPLHGHGKNKDRVVHFSGITDSYNMAAKQCDGCSSLSTFGDALADLEIGEPMAIAQVQHYLFPEDQRAYQTFLRHLDCPVQWDVSNYVNERPSGVTMFINSDFSGWEM